MADSKTYKVVAPAVALKLVQSDGSHVVHHFYKGSVVTAEVEAGSLKHHLDEDMLVEEGAKQAAAVTPDSNPDGTGKGEDLPTAQAVVQATEPSTSRRSGSK